MLKEEARLRKRISDAVWRGIRWSWSTYDQDIRTLVRAVREDCCRILEDGFDLSGTDAKGNKLLRDTATEIRKKR